MSGHRHQFLALDGVRGIGAICVVLAHITFQEEIRYFFARGNGGVNLFFILSGFVIAHAYEAALMSGAMSFKDYFRARMIRLYPVIVLGAVLSVGAAAFLASLAPGHLALLFAMQALLIPILVAFTNIFPLNGPYWSMFFELFVNFAHAAIAKHVTLARLWVVTVLSAIALVACGFLYGELDIGWDPIHFWGGFARVIFSFAVGILLYRYHANGGLPVPRVNALWPLGALALAMWLPMPEWPWLILAYDVLAALVIYPLIMAFAVNAYTPARLGPFFTWLGLISYPLYALHMPIVDVLGAPFLPESVPHALKAAGWLSVLFACVLSASLVATYVDAPIRAWLSRVWRRSAPTATQPAGANGLGREA